jgi:hypothetical protein
MAYQIKDETILEGLKHLAQLRRKTVADVLRDVVRNEVERETGRLSASDRLAPLLAKVASLRAGAPTPLNAEAQKQQFDDLWEQ